MNHYVRLIRKNQQGISKYQCLMEPLLLSYRFYFKLHKYKSTIIDINVQLANRMNLHKLNGCYTTRHTHTLINYVPMESKVNITADHRRLEQPSHCRRGSSKCLRIISLHHKETTRRIWKSKDQIRAETTRLLSSSQAERQYIILLPSHSAVYLPGGSNHLQSALAEHGPPPSTCSGMHHTAIAKKIIALLSK